MKAYQECLGATSTGDAPWYVVPADDKENARLIVSQIVLDTLKGLKMTFRKTDTKRRRELAVHLAHGDLSGGEQRPEQHRGGLW